MVRSKILVRATDGADADTLAHLLYDSTQYGTPTPDIPVLIDQPAALYYFREI